MGFPRDLPRDFETKKLLQKLLARYHWLPEHEIRAALRRADSFGDKKTSCAQSPQNRLMTHLRSQPSGGIDDILNPALPCRIHEVTRAIAATEQVDLKDGQTCIRKGTRLNGSHSTRFIHLLREGVDEQHRAGWSSRVFGPVKQAESIPLLHRQVERIDYWHAVAFSALLSKLRSQ
jgi:hypothetical protein